MIKYIISFSVFILLSISNIYTQSCLPNGIIFCNQQEIDDFSSDYPNCSRIEGKVYILGTFIACSSDINDLSGLSQLNSVGGLTIDFNTQLLNLSGLENISEIDGGLFIRDNTMLSSIEGLSNLKKINGFLNIEYNELLTRLDGLEQVDSINGHLEISYNAKLESINAIRNINPNTIVSSISSAEDLGIFRNPILSTCDLENICQFLYSPGITTEIYDNMDGCMSAEEIKMNCPPPSCTTISYPQDGDFGVSTSTSISWESVNDATGFKISIGTSTGLTDFMDNFDVGQATFLELDTLPCATTLFVNIIPYNESGNALNCQEVVFTTEIVDAKLGPDILLCKEDTIQLTTSNSIGTHYQWTPTESLSNSESPNPFAYPLDTTVYYLNVSNNGRCEDLDSIVVIVQDLPKISTSETDETGLGFNDGSATVNIDGIDSLYSVLWSNGDSTLSIYNLSPNEYYVAVVDTFNCISKDTVLINQFIDGDMDGYGQDSDCNDNNPSINPGVNEIPYNGIDDDCNAGTPDDDLDQDGFLIADDCDDGDMNINPGISEVPYNGVDDDCNAVTPDDDLDQDGFLLEDDCNDGDININPGISEVPYNGVDDDCNAGTLDDDLDQDGFLLEDDCNDEDININPGITEVPYNGIDDDCNAGTPDDDLDQDGFLIADDCDDSDMNINPGISEVPYNGVDDDCNAGTPDDDLDQDGFLIADDCDDGDMNINPGITEVPYNGIDDDCNEVTLDDDLDQDGFILEEDCNDDNANINPEANDIPNNGIDEDCDGMDLISSTYELANTSLDIYPNPASSFINVSVEGQQVFICSLFSLEGKLVKKALSSEQIRINAIPRGNYILEVRDQLSGQKITERIVISR